MYNLAKEMREVSIKQYLLMRETRHKFKPIATAWDSLTLFQLSRGTALCENSFHLCAPRPNPFRVLFLPRRHPCRD